MDNLAMVNAPASKVRLTYDDYTALPDDHNIYEILNGELFVNAAPSLRHQKISGRIYRKLCSDLEDNGLGDVFYAPIDLVLDPENVIQPDLAFVSRENSGIMKENYIDGSPDLVIEILSPSTRQKDLSLKKVLYADHGIVHYWIFDPDENRATQFVLEQGQYRQMALLGLDDTLTSDDFPTLAISLQAIFTD